MVYIRRIEVDYVNIKKGFTLAEVLITLGIIGIVAALTMPMLLAHQQQVALRTALLKNYSVLYQAVEHMSADLGMDIVPSNFARQGFKQYFIKYFNVLYDCGLGSTDITDHENAATYCASEQHYEGTTTRFTEHYKTFDGGRYLDPTLLNNGQFVLNDGSLVMIENWDNNYIYISVDVNGIKKRPNVWGKDLFTFQLTTDGKLLPMGAPKTKYHDRDQTYCSKTGSSTYNGVSCAHQAIVDPEYFKNNL